MRPDHYKTGSVQPIDLIFNIGDRGKEFCRGNVIKYVARFDRKDGVTDLLKARQYLDWLIEIAEREKADAEIERK